MDTLGHVSNWAASAGTGSIDTVVPTVTNVSSTSANAYYKTGNTVDITVTFSENVLVTTPVQLSLLLETGTTDRNALYLSGSGSTALVFQYTVQAGDAAADLNYESLSALSIGTGSIKDAAGNAAILSLPALAGAASLATQKNVIIDTTAPTSPVAVTLPSSQSTSLSFNLSWTASTDTNFKTHNVKICSNAACDSGCISALTSVNSPASVTGVNGASYYACVQGEDNAGLTSAWINSSGTIALDNTLPTVTNVSSTKPDGAYKSGVSIPISVQFSEAVVLTDPSQLGLLLETGTPDRTAVYLSGDGSNTLIFNYVVQAGDVASDLNYESTSALTLGTGTIKDAAGNAATLTLPALGGASSLATQKALVIDTTAVPAVPVISVPAQNAFVIANLTTVTGTSEANASITIISGGSTIGTGTASGTSWSVTLNSPLSDGNYAITAVATDAAGNASSATAARNFEVDTSGPNLPVITTVTSPNASTTPAVSGTWEDTNMSIALLRTALQQEPPQLTAQVTGA